MYTVSAIFSAHRKSNEAEHYVIKQVGVNASITFQLL